VIRVPAAVFKGMVTMPKDLPSKVTRADLEQYIDPAVVNRVGVAFMLLFASSLRHMDPAVLNRVGVAFLLLFASSLCHIDPAVLNRVGVAFLLLFASSLSLPSSTSLYFSSILRFHLLSLILTICRRIGLTSVYVPFASATNNTHVVLPRQRLPCLPPVGFNIGCIALQALDEFLHMEECTVLRFCSFPFFLLLLALLFVQV
jgi:hypothetical protein